MLECPNCHEKTIPKSKRFWIGPIRSIRCDNCDAKVSIPYSSLFYITIYLLLMIVFPRLGISPYITIALTIITCVAFLFLHYKFVPLIIKYQKGDEGYRKQKISNTILGIIYLLVSFGIILFIPEIIKHYRY